ncbi:MAG TPA: hypothetical protein VFH20_10415, partial [Propionibacteriaceae bacterium]|nr:hypothetical protein [Propionibacteriaceae bacterium]
AAPLGDLPLAVLAVSEQPVGGELLTALQRELAPLCPGTPGRRPPRSDHGRSARAVACRRAAR